MKESTFWALLGWAMFGAFYYISFLEKWHIGHIEDDVGVAVVRRLGTLVGGML